jgi:hypothetical protein
MVGTTNVAASEGVVRFSGLGIEGEAATGLVIRFSTEYPAGTTFETTQSINLTAGLATKFSIIQQPTTVKTRSQFTNAISVQLLDKFNNPVPTDSTTVVTGQLYKSTELATATTNRTLPVISAQASGGVATFTGLALPVLPSTGYAIQFELDTFSSFSNTFEVLPGDAITATITRQPSSVVGSGLMKTGDLIPIQPEITLYDEDGYVARGDTGTVSVAITSGSGGTITGTTSRSVVNGIADFSGMRLIGTPSQGSTPAQQYKLTFSFGNISSLPSDVLTVTNADAAKLSVSWTSPTGVAGEIFTDKPVVTILDRFGNVVECWRKGMVPARQGWIVIVTVSRFHAIKTFVSAIQTTYGHSVSTAKQFLPEKTRRYHQVVLKYGFLTQSRVIGHFGGNGFTLCFSKQTSFGHGWQNLIHRHWFYDG